MSLSYDFQDFADMTVEGFVISIVVAILLLVVKERIENWGFHRTAMRDLDLADRLGRPDASDDEKGASATLRKSVAARVERRSRRADSLVCGLGDFIAMFFVTIWFFTTYSLFSAARIFMGQPLPLGIIGVLLVLTVLCGFAERAVRHMRGKTTDKKTGQTGCD